MPLYINIGFNHMISHDKIYAIVPVDGAVSRRNIAAAKDNLTLIDATHGRKTRSIIYTNHYLILSALQPDTITARIEN